MNKIIGWLLILIGLVIIFLSIYFSYNIFTAKSEAPEIFSISIESDTDLKIGLDEKAGIDQEIEGQIESLIEERLDKMIPSDFLPILFNLLAWSVFSGILIFAGAQMAVIGIKIIKA